MIKSIYTYAVAAVAAAAAAAVVDSQITNVVEKFCFIYSSHLHFAHKSNCIRRMQYQMLNFREGMTVPEHCVECSWTVPLH